MSRSFHFVYVFDACSKISPDGFVYVFDACSKISPDGKDCAKCAAGRGWGLCLNQPRPVRHSYVVASDEDGSVEEIGRLHPGMDVCPGRALTAAELQMHAPSVAEANRIADEKDAEFERLLAG